LLSSLVPRNANPTVDRTPANAPIVSAPAGWRFSAAADPTATPPASVAFWTDIISNRLLMKEEVTKVETQEPRRERRVLTTQLRN
jgi:hypothetical protein